MQKTPNRPKGCSDCQDDCEFVEQILQRCVLLRCSIFGKLGQCLRPESADLLLSMTHLCDVIREYTAEGERFLDSVIGCLSAASEILLKLKTLITTGAEMDGF